MGEYPAAFIVVVSRSLSSLAIGEVGLERQALAQRLRVPAYLGPYAGRTAALEAAGLSE
jgi:hypothetical protein